MTAYFEAPDGHGESCIWAPNPDYPDLPLFILRASSVRREFWPDVVARMTGTSITTDDATVEKIARAICRSQNSDPHIGWDSYRDSWLRDAHEVLAALTGVPHD